MDFEHQLKALIFFHLEEHTSASHLLQVLKEDDFAAEHIAPQDGIEKSSFSEANNTRGLEQFLQVFQALYTQANKALPIEYAELGELVAIDGSLIDVVLSILEATKGRFMLSINDVPEIWETFKDFQIEAVKTTYSIGNTEPKSGRMTHHKAPKALSGF